MLSFLGVGTAIGPARPSDPVTLGLGAGVLGGSVNAVCGAAVVVPWFLCLSLAAVSEVMATKERERESSV